MSFGKKSFVVSGDGYRVTCAVYVDGYNTPDRWFYVRTRARKRREGLVSDTHMAR